MFENVTLTKDGKTITVTTDYFCNEKELYNNPEESNSLQYSGVCILGQQQYNITAMYISKRDTATPPKWRCACYVKDNGKIEFISKKAQEARDSSYCVRIAIEHYYDYVEFPYFDAFTSINFSSNVPFFGDDLTHAQQYVETTNTSDALDLLERYSYNYKKSRTVDYDNISVLVNKYSYINNSSTINNMKLYWTEYYKTWGNEEITNEYEVTSDNFYKDSNYDCYFGVLPSTSSTSEGINFYKAKLSNSQETRTGSSHFGGSDGTTITFSEFSDEKPVYVQLKWSTYTITYDVTKSTTHWYNGSTPVPLGTESGSWTFYPLEPGGFRFRETYSPNSRTFTYTVKFANVDYQFWNPLGQIVVDGVHIAVDSLPLEPNYEVKALTLSTNIPIFNSLGAAKSWAATGGTDNSAVLNFVSSRVCDPLIIRRQMMPSMVDELYNRYKMVISTNINDKIINNYTQYGGYPSASVIINRLTDEPVLICGTQYPIYDLFQGAPAIISKKNTFLFDTYLDEAKTISGTNPQLGLIGNSYTTPLGHTYYIFVSRYRENQYTSTNCIARTKSFGCNQFPDSARDETGVKGIERDTFDTDSGRYTITSWKYAGIGMLVDYFLF